MSLSIPSKPPILNMQKIIKNIRKPKKMNCELKLLDNRLKNHNGILKARNAQLQAYIEKMAKEE